MKRKLYALLILIGTFAGLALFYMYFFVYYTSSLEITANVSSFHVKLFNSSLAQSIEADCSENPCFLTDIPPLTYNATFSAENYEAQNLEIKIGARKTEKLILNFEKKLILEPQVLDDILGTETPEEKIQRLQENSDYEKVFSLQNGNFGIKTENEKLSVYEISSENSRLLSEFPRVPLSEIRIQDISSSSDIFLDFSGKYYIYKISQNELISLPYTIKISYIKKAPLGNVYHIVTENGSFYYENSTGKSQYQYPFFDFVQMGNVYLGIIESDDTERKKNYDISQSGNVIIRYDSDTKEKRILYSTADAIDKIYWQGEKLLLEKGGEIYEIKNY